MDFAPSDWAPAAGAPTPGGGPVGTTGGGPVGNDPGAGPDLKTRHRSEWSDNVCMRHPINDLGRGSTLFKVNFSCFLYRQSTWSLQQRHDSIRGRKARRRTIGNNRRRAREVHLVRDEAGRGAGWPTWRRASKAHGGSLRELLASRSRFQLCSLSCCPAP
jgi:hypothetical protein